MSVGLWNFKDVGSFKAIFLAVNQHTQRKLVLYFLNTMNVSSSKIGHDFRKKSGSKITIEVRKNDLLK